MASKEERLSIAGPVGKLEVSWRTPLADGSLSHQNYCAVVCHPHPQHGGTMDNKVVTTVARAYADCGVPVVRFNFRGVGHSDGSYDEGVGEVEDLKAVVDWFREAQGAAKVLLAGFSFGSGVASNGCRQIDGVAHTLFVAPPVQRYNFSPADTYPCPVAVVVAGEDELVDSDQIRSWAQSLSPEPRVIELEGASHFFHGQLVKLREAVKSTLVAQL